MIKEVRMLLPKKELIQVEYIGKSNDYYEDIYIPPGVLKSKICGAIYLAPKWKSVPPNS